MNKDVKHVSLTGKESLYEIEYRYIDVFKKGFAIEFNSGLNVIVGDNGCGKSTLFEIIGKKITNAWNLEVNVDMVTEGLSHENFFAWDFEKDNPKFNKRMSPNPLTTNSKEYNDKLLFVIGTNQESHGETNIGCLESIMGLKGFLLILDEPDSALSLVSQYK